MKRYFLFFIFFLFISKGAFAILSVDINSGKIQKQKVLVVGLDKNYNRDAHISDIIRNDLNNSNIFDVYFNLNIDFESNNLRSQDKGIFDNLLQKDISFLVLVNIRQSDSKNFFINYEIWNVALKKNCLEKSIHFKIEDLRKIAHSVSDDIYFSSTGFSGYFNTKIFYIAETGGPIKKIKRLAVMDYDGFNNRFLTDGRFLILTPRISNDNSKILYVSYEKRIPKVFMFDLKTGKHQDLFVANGISSAPRFAFHKNNLILAAVSEFGSTNIVKFDLSTGARKKITNNKFINTSPSYSPDNNEIVFSSDMLGKGKSQIFIIRPDGSNQSKITLGEGQYFNPVFSPNGEYIAFTKILKGNFYIGIMKKDGSGEKILAGGYMIESPCWCPNSKLIAFSSTNRSNNSSIYMVDISGKFHKKISIQSNNEKGYFGAIDPIWVNF